MEHFSTYPKCLHLHGDQLDDLGAEHGGYDGARVLTPEHAHAWQGLHHCRGATGQHNGYQNIDQRLKLIY